MDRTSILGDTIDYMKELLDKIQKLQTENAEEHKELKPSEALSRNPPKVFFKFLEVFLISVPIF